MCYAREMDFIGHTHYYDLNFVITHGHWEAEVERGGNAAKPSGTHEAVEGEALRKLLVPLL